MKRSSKSGRETPPLTRGRLIDTSIGWKVLRNTPAYAGKTQCSIHPVKRRGKHPRLRGEDTPNCREARLPLETPPLTRGRPRSSKMVFLSVRNTPAYAGKTTTRPAEATPGEKHPRLRGEDHREGLHTIPAWETPPLTRGRLSRSALSKNLLRNTPAYAGKTNVESAD